LLCVVTAGFALTAAPALAGTATVSASPSTNVHGGDTINATLSGADGHQSVIFVECDQAATDSHGGTPYCTVYSNGDAVPVTNGAASGSVTAVYGSLGTYQDAPSCTETNPNCVIAALDGSNYQEIASTPISLAAGSAETSTPTVSATPSTGLTNNQAVSVDVSNISAGVSTVDITECNTDAAASQGSYFEGACKLLAEGTAAGNAYSTSVNVIDGNLGGTVRCDENTPAGHCVIAALDHNGQTVIATTPISFETPQTGVTVTPDSGLKDGQTVAVNASGLPTEDPSFIVAECDTRYATSPSSYDEGLTGCTYGDDGYVQASNGSFSTSVDVVDGALTYDNDGNPDTSGPTCDYATNGNCAIVTLAPQPDPETGYDVVDSHPITFRPPVTGPATPAVSPTTGLHNGSTVTVSTPNKDVPDGIGGVLVKECNTSLYPTRGNALSCFGLGSETVTNNAVVPKALSVVEGTSYVSASKTVTCDYTNACEIGLFEEGYAGDPDTLVSRFVPIAFRNPNIGKTTFTLSAQHDLKNNQKVTVSVTNIPDEVFFVYVEECDATDVKGGFDRDSPCQGLTEDALPVKNNAVTTTVKVYDGGLFDKNNKEVYCDSASKDHCVFTLEQYQSAAQGYRYTFVPNAASAPLSFSKSDTPKVTVSKHTHLGKKTKVTVHVSHVEDAIAVGLVALCSTKHPSCIKNHGTSPVADFDLHRGGGSVHVTIASECPAKPYQLCATTSHHRATLEVQLGDRRIHVPVTFKG
jgi:hypothetical protein